MEMEGAEMPRQGRRTYTRSSFLWATQTCPERLGGFKEWPLGSSNCSQAGFETTASGFAK